MKCLVRVKSYPNHPGNPGHVGGSVAMGADTGASSGGDSSKPAFTPEEQKLKTDYEAKLADWKAKRTARYNSLRKYAKTATKRELLQLITSRVHSLNEKSSNTDIIYFVLDNELPAPRVPRSLRGRVQEPS